VKPLASAPSARNPSLVNAEKLKQEVLFDGALHVTEEGWRILTWRWAFFFLGASERRRSAE
jgi:hypothetical protein